MASCRHRRIATLAAIGLALALPVPSAMAGDDAGGSGLGSMIVDVLPPHRVGAAMCMEGRFQGKAVDVEDWGKTTSEPVPGLVQFGKQVTRPVPEIRPDQTVTDVRLRLVQERPTFSGEDRHYGFQLLLRLAGWPEPLLAAGDCSYTSHHRKGDTDASEPTTTTLHCGIDCDGGGIEVARAGVSRQLDFAFSEFGLRMSGGCSHGHYRIETIRRDKVTGDPLPGQSPPVFRLTRVPLKTCASLARLRGE